MSCKYNPPGASYGGQRRLNLFAGGGLALGFALAPAMADVLTLATLVTSGETQILTIPVNAQFMFSANSTNDTILNLAGQLVAFRTAAGVATAPVLQSLTVQTQVVTLQWQVPAGQQFQVQSSTDLMAWQTNAVNVTSDSTNYTWSGPATGANGYFRLKQ